MKIKKKEYEKQLDDKYWKGIEGGIKFALDHPETATKYRDNIRLMRYEVEQASEIANKIANILKQLFKR